MATPDWIIQLPDGETLKIPDVPLISDWGGKYWYINTAFRGDMIAIATNWSKGMPDASASGWWLDKQAIGEVINIISAYILEKKGSDYWETHNELVVPKSWIEKNWLNLLVTIGIISGGGIIGGAIYKKYIKK